MKIAILTQPLHNNYGGLLQAFSLQYYLKSLGHDVLTVDFSTDPTPRFMGIKPAVGNIIKKFILRRKVKSILPLTGQQNRFISQHTNRFTAEYIRTTQKIHSVEEFSYIKQYQFDAYVVGSDQVWRPSYSPDISAFFLSFLDNDDKVKRVAFAASFGGDNCDEYTPKQLLECGNLLQRFDAVGVREDSAITLCKKYFNTDAEHVIDPTLLLDKEIYHQLTLIDKVSVSKGNMFVYVLDQNSDKQQIISQIASERCLDTFTIMPEKDSVYPSVTQWLRGFIDAEYVVTDSFHGVVFSIIFNKPFIAIGNHDRGLARFTSILNIFGLQERLIFSSDDLTPQLINQPIDYSKVNRLKADKKKLAVDFLNKALSEK